LGFPDEERRAGFHGVSLGIRVSAAWYDRIRDVAAVVAVADQVQVLFFGYGDFPSAVRLAGVGTDRLTHAEEDSSGVAIGLKEDGRCAAPAGAGGLGDLPVARSTLTRGRQVLPYHGFYPRETNTPSPWMSCVNTVTARAIPLRCRPKAKISYNEYRTTVHAGSLHG
jgi:hypothetical protein